MAHTCIQICTHAHTQRVRYIDRRVERVEVRELREQMQVAAEYNIHVQEDAQADKQR